MLRTPLKNSKGVNKPFKSPFESPLVNADSDVKRNSCTKSIPNKKIEAKRVLLLDDSIKECKKRKLNDIKLESQSIVQIPEHDLTKRDLQMLKRKIFEMRQELDRLKSRERCTKKNNPKELKISISTWKSACQTALETLCFELTERNGQSCSISNVLETLNIPASIVGYSEKEDSFT
ncbi:uncharacterized protein LOC106657909 [Trichogramma pretiosum]|uniref:uncharacterized protein LOC106657909 n=1 Tax=Trichogramma pretiosum TaxID=7493 RepID=UPI0006C9BA5A|nr:uncharacterized protein LOC106657909 [Trichogramma pretiosum]